MARVRLFAVLREAARIAEDEIEAPTVGALVEEAKRRYGSIFSESLSYSNIAVNGTLINDLQGEETALAAGDEVAFLPPVSGGCEFDRIV